MGRPPTPTVASATVEWGWIAPGEREVRLPEPASLGNAPAWMREVRLQGLDRFSRVASMAELRGVPPPESG